MLLLELEFWCNDNPSFTVFIRRNANTVYNTWFTMKEIWGQTFYNTWFTLKEIWGQTFYNTWFIMKEIWGQTSRPRDVLHQPGDPAVHSLHVRRPRIPGEPSTADQITWYKLSWHTWNSQVPALGLVRRWRFQPLMLVTGHSLIRTSAVRLFLICSDIWKNVFVLNCVRPFP